MTKFNQDRYLRSLKLKKYSKYLYLGILCIFCFGIGVYFTYSKYSVSKEEEVVRTTVRDFIYGDVVIGAYVNGEYSSELPKKGNGYVAEKVVCDNGAVGEWNDDEWYLVTKNLTKRSKCNIYFISDVRASFGYTGGEQVFTAPVSGIYKLETWGAQGGNTSETILEVYTSKIGGFGAYATGKVALEKDEVIYISIGQKGNSTISNSSSISTNCSTEKSYNGGGSAFIENCVDVAGSGGGATHIAIKSGELYTLEKYKESILLVAAGGGGSYSHLNYASNGGNGGGISGGLPQSLEDGGICSDRTLTLGIAASQISGGTTSGCTAVDTDQAFFGFGNSTLSGWGSGGGGGYYGGGAGRTAYGAGGGSSYIGNSLLTEKAMYCYNCQESSEESTKTISTTCSEETPTENCSKKGNGYARITLVSID